MGDTCFSLCIFCSLEIIWLSEGCSTRVFFVFLRALWCTNNLNTIFKILIMHKWLISDRRKEWRNKDNCLISCKKRFNILIWQNENRSWIEGINRIGFCLCPVQIGQIQSKSQHANFYFENSNRIKITGNLQS